ncbi:MAG: acyl-CoA desaturase [Polyangiaceae bacterium]
MIAPAVDAPASSLTGATGRIAFAPVKATWLYANLALGLLALPYRAGAGTFAAGFALTFLTLCVGHSVGLHRGIIHRTYRCPRSVRCALAYLFVLSGLGGPVAWMGVHYARDHWQNRADCPRFFGYGHGIAVDYHWNLHCAFLAGPSAPHAVPEEDASDPFLMFLQRTWMVHPILLAAVVAALFGPAVAGVTCCLRVGAGILGHWFVGYVSHKVGYMRYALDDASSEGRNVLVLGVLSFGEGFHNNHHAHPGSARMGMKWYELDAGWAVVRCLEALGWIHDVRAWHRAGQVSKAGARAIAARFVGPGRLRRADRRSSERDPTGANAGARAAAGRGAARGSAPRPGRRSQTTGAAHPQETVVQAIHAMCSTGTTSDRS